MQPALWPRLIIGGLTCSVAVSACGASVATGASTPPATGVAGSVRPTPTPPTTAPTSSSAIPAPATGLPAGWNVLSTIHGRPSLASRTVLSAGSTVTLVRFDAASTRLVLHPGYQDPGGYGWSTHSVVLPAERPVLLAAFNGGFKLNLGDGGMAVGTRQAGRLQPGLASVVTYTDGSTQLGTWGVQVPMAGHPVASVRQNLHLLVSGGRAAADVDAIADWGATIQGAVVVARSALGIDGQGNMIWAGSTAATPRALAEALIAVGAQRAMELDINPYWVCAFSFTPTAQIPLLAGQHRPVGTYLTPWQRDFFTVDAK